MNELKKIERKIKAQLSHIPVFYALVVGAGIIMFWRGIWHTTDYVFTYLHTANLSPYPVDFFVGFWWDGPLSVLIGIIILYFTGALTSSFIGNELILSGLRGEKKLNEQTEESLKNEVSAIADIKDEINIVAKKLEVLENHAHNNHKKVEPISG